MKISVSLVLYNNTIKEVLNVLNCFLSSSIISKVYIIDNSPNDLISCNIFNNKVIFLHNPTNPGFGSSHNIAIKESISESYDYHIVSNVDINFLPGTIEGILEFMQKNINVGQVMPKVLLPNNNIQHLCKKNPTVFDLFVRGFVPIKFHKYLNKRLREYEYLNYDYDNIIFDIPYLSGCFMFFRNSSLKKIGFFDEKFFMYLEDADITRRMLIKYSTAYYPYSSIFHEYSGLTHKKFKFRFITIQSAFIYFSKWGWLKNIY
jgi:GT2 family glycosyltransferase